MKQAEQHDGGQGKGEAVDVEHLSKPPAWMDPFHQPLVLASSTVATVSNILTVWSLEALRLTEM